MSFRTTAGAITKSGSRFAGCSREIHTANVQQIASSGAIYHAMSIFPIGGTPDGSDPQRISRCMLLVSTRELDNPDPAVSAAGIVEALSRMDDGGETQLSASQRDRRGEHRGITCDVGHRGRRTGAVLCTY